MTQVAAPLGINVVNPKMEQMISVAKQLSLPGKGFLASDEKEAGMGSKFDLINLENTKTNRLKYRTMLYTTPNVEEYLSGIIFNHETFTEGKIEKTGERLVDYVTKKGILPGIKVDIGPRPLPYKPNEQYTAGIDGLLQRAASYYENGARFTKLRVIFRIQNGYISPTAMTENMYLSAKYALICQANGLVPIVEPDLVMNGDHSAAVCKYWTNKILNRMYAVLNEYDVELKATILKPNMILSGKGKVEKRSFKENALNTIDVLSNNVPVSVPGILFLSGGMCEEEATLNLNAINKLYVQRLGRVTINRAPWCISFSFGRALQHSAVMAWQGKDENVNKAQTEFLHRARANSEASLGVYDGWAMKKSDLETMKKRGYSVEGIESYKSKSKDDEKENEILAMIDALTDSIAK